MVAALDYDPRDGPAGGLVKGKMSLRVGDVVTVYGPAEDKGFYYGESGGHRGLVSVHLLDHMSLQGERVQLPTGVVASSHLRPTCGPTTKPSSLCAQRPLHAPMLGTLSHPSPPGLGGSSA